MDSRHTVENRRGDDALARERDALAWRMRESMVAHLFESGALASTSVGEAMLTVPRHQFLPQAELTDSYADEAVVIRVSPTGQPLSSISQPTMVAKMLELLDVRVGQRILEIGTGTGYNAALLARLVGTSGRVVTMELEQRLAEAARRRLTQLGIKVVEVRTGDGREGWPPEAPYDGVVVTAGAGDVAPAWGDQLAEDGRMVLPLVDERGSGWVHTLQKRQGELIGHPVVACGFLPIRSVPGTTGVDG